MDNRDTRDRLAREGDSWLERARAEEVMQRERRHAEEVDIQRIVVTGICFVLAAAALVWFIERVSQ